MRNPCHVRDTDEKACERTAKNNGSKLLSVVGLELLVGTPDWLRLLVVGAVGGVAVGLLLVATEKAVRKCKYKQNHEQANFKGRNMSSSVAAVKREQELYQKLEELFASSSSNVEDDLEDIAAKSYLNEQLIQLLEESNEISSRNNFTGWVEKKIETFSLIVDYIDRYWDSIPEDKHIVFIQVACILHSTMRSSRYIEELDKDLYSFYQGIVFSFLYKLSEKLKKDNPEDYLWAFKDSEGNSVNEFPSSAEKKAVDRLKDIGDESQWVSLPIEEKEITDEEIEEYMKKRGLS